MLRIDHHPPKPLSPHQRDLPSPHAQPPLHRGAGGVDELMLMVVCYLAAMFFGILLLGALAPTVSSSHAAISRS